MPDAGYGQKLVRRYVAERIDKEIEDALRPDVNEYLHTEDKFDKNEDDIFKELAKIADGIEKKPEGHKIKELAKRMVNNFTQGNMEYRVNRFLGEANKDTVINRLACCLILVKQCLGEMARAALDFFSNCIRAVGNAISGFVDKIGGWRVVAVIVGVGVGVAAGAAAGVYLPPLVYSAVTYIASLSVTTKVCAAVGGAVGGVFGGFIGFKKGPRNAE